MFDNIQVDLLQEYKLGELLTPVIWGYIEDVTRPGYFPNGIFHRYFQVFNEVLIAGAYKGANGVSQTFMNTTHYIKNLESYRHLNLIFSETLGKMLSGVILTGWSRYSHFRPLCELLPISIPTLIQEAIYLKNWALNEGDSKLAAENKLLEYLECKIPDEKDALKPIEYNEGVFHPPRLETLLTYCDFLGVDLFKEIEKLRIIHWKIHMKKSGENLEPSLEDEIVQLKQRIIPILQRYFYENTIDEWIRMNFGFYIKSR